MYLLELKKKWHFNLKRNNKSFYVELSVEKNPFLDQPPKSVPAGPLRDGAGPWVSDTRITTCLTHQSLTERLNQGRQTGWLTGWLRRHPRPQAKAEGRNLSLSWGGGIPRAGARQLEAALSQLAPLSPDTHVL